LEEIRNGLLAVSEVGLSEKYALSENPVSEQIKIKLNASFNYSEVNITAYSVSGQQVFSEKIEKAEGEISLNHSLSSGIYILNIRDSRGAYNLKFAVD
jgi:hypothetical protein